MSTGGEAQMGLDNESPERLVEFNRAVQTTSDGLANPFESDSSGCASGGSFDDSCCFSAM